MLTAEAVKLVKLILVMPATKDVSERSFSSLKKMKTYLRSRATDNRLRDYSFSTGAKLHEKLTFLTP